MTSSTAQILVLPGDGIGAEIMPQVLRVLDAAATDAVKLNIAEADMGGVSIDKYGTPLTDETLSRAKEADAVLLGAVGGPKWDDLPVDRKPEKGLLGLRYGLDCFANLRRRLRLDPWLTLRH